MKTINLKLDQDDIDYLDKIFSDLGVKRSHANSQTLIKDALVAIARQYLIVKRG